MESNLCTNLGFLTIMQVLQGTVFLATGNMTYTTENSCFAQWGRLLVFWETYYAALQGMFFLRCRGQALHYGDSYYDREMWDSVEHPLFYREQRFVLWGTT